MPNTKSAESRARNSVRRHDINNRAKSRLKTLEKSYLELLQAGKKEEAATALKAVSSALDKAAKTGSVHARKASRKKSRLTVTLNKAK